MRRDPASPRSAGPRHDRPTARSRRGPLRPGRIVLLAVVVLLAGSYVRPVVDAIATHGEAGRQEARLAQLERDHRRLVAETRRLGTPAGLVEEGRRLGMVRDGERAYVVRGLRGSPGVD